MNNNPKGCNQYTGKHCSGMPKKDGKKEAMSMSGPEGRKGPGKKEDGCHCADKSK
ncbi:hypothetical protein KL86DPRO_10821 [uncultured delta proteobacterium]|uniref:Uncharacterized protein n=1 Tax=uncultured delta proteobacterium TaxID=34034 RepID=A0A212J6X2_9DELT|nr:hypothetical protein KL86DPRO_10821 [uncultured delta proteobacterium]